MLRVNLLDQGSIDDPAAGRASADAPVPAQYDHPLWKVAGIAAFLASAAYVWAVNKDVGPADGATFLSRALSPQGLAISFRLVSAYAFSRWGPPLIEERVNRWSPDSRTGRVAGVLGLNGGVGVLEGLVYHLVGAHAVASTYPFIVTGGAFQAYHVESRRAGRGGLTGRFDDAREWVRNRHAYEWVQDRRAYVCAWGDVFVRRPLVEHFVQADR